MGVRVVIQVVVGVMEVACGVRMGVGVGGAGNRGEDVVCSGGNVIVADGEGARWKDCCRFHDRIFRKLWEVVAGTPAIGTLRGLSYQANRSDPRKSPSLGDSKDHSSI